MGQSEFKCSSPYNAGQIITVSRLTVSFNFLSWRTSVDGPQSRRQDPQQAEDPQPRCRRQDQAGDPESQTLQAPAHHQAVSGERRRRVSPCPEECEVMTLLI